MGIENLRKLKSDLSNNSCVLGINYYDDGVTIQPLSMFKEGICNISDVCMKCEEVMGNEVKLLCYNDVDFDEVGLETGIYLLCKMDYAKELKRRYDEWYNSNEDVNAEKRLDDFLRSISDYVSHQYIFISLHPSLDFTCHNNGYIEGIESLQYDKCGNVLGIISIDNFLSHMKDMGYEVVLYDEDFIEEITSVSDILKHLIDGFPKIAIRARNLGCSVNKSDLSLDDEIKSINKKK